MVHTVDRSLWAVAAAALVVATACNDPQSPKPDAQLSPPNGGTLLVATNSKGSDVDADGYSVWLDGSRSQAIGPNDLVTFSGLAAGDHAVALYGIAPNCAVYTRDKGSNNPRTASLIEGVAASTVFTLHCESWGGLFVSTKTSGVDLDADGYRVTVDGRASQSTATNGSVTFTGVYAGSHSVALSGVAGNCTVSGSNPGTVTVSAGGTASMTFSASCAPTGSGSGRLTVTTDATGSNLDPDGYTVTLDRSFSEPIATRNGRVTFTGPAGDHPVALSGVASNCTVSGANPRTVTVPADGTTTTTFSVTCGARQARVMGRGQLGMGSPTPNNDVQTFDFDLRADLTGRFTGTDYGDIHASGVPATLTTDPSTDPATSFTAYRNSSSVCRDPSGGAEFDGVGREEEGDVVSYTVVVCDDGPEGSGMDFLSVFLSPEGYGRSGTVTSGDIVKQ
jgi:hypothetical protein